MALSVPVPLPWMIRRLGDAPAQALPDVFGDEVPDVLGAERVEVEDAVDEKLDGIVGEVGGIAGLVRHAPMLTQNRPAGNRRSD